MWPIAEHIGLAQFAKAADIPYKPVAMGSGLQMVQGLVSGELDATLPNVSDGGAMIEDGSIRPLAVMAKERLAGYPDVPITWELGYEVSTSTTRGYALLADTPPEIVEKLSEQVVDAMKHEAFANYLKSAGLDAETSVAGTKIWDALLKEEYAKATEALEVLVAAE